MTISFLKKCLALPCTLLMSGSLYAEVGPLVTSNGVVSGSIGAVSKYIYRGGVENDNVAIQTGLEYAHKSGVSVGYWGSTLDYDATDDHRNHGFEHDVYIAYGNEVNENLSYKLQTTAYIYHHGGTVYGDEHKRKTTDLDVLAELAYKEFTFATSIMLADASYANAGDTYLSISYEHELPKNFILSASVGGSIYNSSRDDELIQTTKDIVFNEARVGLSKSIADSKVVASIEYAFGGEDRLGEDLDNHMIFGLNYYF